MAIRISHFSSYTLRFNINQLQLIHNSCCCHIFNKLHYIVYIHLLPFLLRSRPIWILASPKDVKVSCSSSIFCVIPVILKKWSVLLSAKSCKNHSIKNYFRNTTSCRRYEDFANKWEIVPLFKYNDETKRL